MAWRYFQVWDLRTNSVNPNLIRAVDDDGTEHWVPTDDANRDWRDYQAWLAKGNMPNPPPEAPSLGDPTPRARRK